MNLNNFGVSFMDTSIFSSDTEYGSDLNFLPFIQDLDFEFENSTYERVGIISSRNTHTIGANELPDLKLNISTIETFSGLFSDFFVDGQLSENLNSSRNFYLLHGYHPQRVVVNESCMTADEPLELIYSTSPSTYITTSADRGDIISYPKTTFTSFKYELLTDFGVKKPQVVSVVGEFEYEANPVCISYDTSDSGEFVAIDYIKETGNNLNKRIKIYTEPINESLLCFVNHESESEFIDYISADEEDKYITTYTESPSGYKACIIANDRPQREVDLNIINAPKNLDSQSVRNFESLANLSVSLVASKDDYVDHISQTTKDTIKIDFLKSSIYFTPRIIIKYLFPKRYFNFTQEFEEGISIEDFESIDIIEDIIENEQINRINYVGTNPTYIAIETKLVYDISYDQSYESFFLYDGISQRINELEPLYISSTKYCVIDLESTETVEQGIFNDRGLFPLYQDFENEIAVELSHGGAIEIQDFEEVNHYKGLTGIYDESLDGVSIVTKSVRFELFWKDYIEGFEKTTTQQIKDLEVGCHKQRVDHQDFQYTEFEIGNVMRPYIPLTEKSLTLFPMSFSNFESVRHYNGLTGVYDLSPPEPSIVTKILLPFISEAFESSNIISEVENCQSFKEYYLNIQTFEYLFENSRKNVIRDYIPLEEYYLLKSDILMERNWEQFQHYDGLTGEYLDSFLFVELDTVPIVDMEVRGFEDYQIGSGENLSCLIPSETPFVPKQYYDFEDSEDMISAQDKLGSNYLIGDVALFADFEGPNQIKEYGVFSNDSDLTWGIEDFEAISSNAWTYNIFTQFKKYIYNIEDFESNNIQNIYTTPANGFRSPDPWPDRKYSNSICFGNVFLNSIKIKQSYNGVMSSQYSYTALNMLAQKNKSVQLGNQYFSTGLMPSINLIGDQEPVGNFSINSLDSYQPEFGDATKFIPGSKTHLIISGENSNQSFLVKPDNIQSFDLDFSLKRETIRSVNKKFAVAATPVGPFLGKLSVDNIFSDLEYGDSSNLYKALKTDQEYNVIISGKRFDDTDFKINISKAQLNSKSLDGSLSQNFKEKMDFTFGMGNINLIL